MAVLTKKAPHPRHERGSYRESHICQGRWRWRKEERTSKRCCSSNPSGRGKPSGGLNGPIQTGSLLAVEHEWAADLSDGRAVMRRTLEFGCTCVFEQALMRQAARVFEQVTVEPKVRAPWGMNLNKAETGISKDMPAGPAVRPYRWRMNTNERPPRLSSRRLDLRCARCV